MALPFHPEAGTIVICDFRGFVEPEIVKKRPAIVISPRSRHGSRLSTIVPLSTSTPLKPECWHYLLDLNPPLPPPFDAPQCWVKGNMLYTVSHDRLDLPHKKDPSGKREYIKHLISAKDLKTIRNCTIYGLGVDRLTVATPGSTL
jgi:uncharacterized protein YifN (PemK superfamily)